MIRECANFSCWPHSLSLSHILTLSLATNALFFILALSQFLSTLLYWIFFSPLFFQMVMDKVLVSKGLTTLIVLVSLLLYFGLSLTVVPLLRQRLDVKFARGADNQAKLVGNHHRHPNRQGHGVGARLL